MNIGLDYDNTYTRDPEAWDSLINLMRDRGHKVYVVTMRYEEYEGDVVKKALSQKVDGIYFTARKAKQPKMFNNLISVDVWIDDTPFFILNDARG